MGTKVQLRLLGLLIGTLSLADLQAQTYSTVVSASQQIDTNNFVASHSSSIVKLKAGKTLPNGQTLANDRLIVTAFAGFLEGFADQTVWHSRSDDGGVNWTIPDTLTTYPELKGDTTAFNMGLFLDSSYKLTCFYLLKPSRNKSFPLWIQSRSSLDGGVSWGAPEFHKLHGMDDSSKFRLGSFFSYISLRADTFAAPLHYRLTNRNDAYYGFVRFTSDLSYFEVDTFRTYALAHPDRRVEPMSAWFGNRIYSFIRTTNGFVEYIYSSDYGRSWSPLHKTSIPHSGTKFDVFNRLGKLYMVTNVNYKRRDNLTVLELDSNLNPVKSFEIAHLSTEEQLSYPAVAIDGNEINVCYTHMFIDKNNSYMRRGDLRFAKLSFQDLQPVDNVLDDYKVPQKSTSTRTYFTDYDHSASNELAFVEYRAGGMQFLNNGSWSAPGVLDSSTLFYSISYLNNDTVLLSSVPEISEYDKVNNSLSTYNSSEARIIATRPYGGSSTLAFKANQMFLFDRATKLAGMSIPFTGGNIPYFSRYQVNINDVAVVSHDSIYFLTANGDLYVSHDTLSNYSLLKAGVHVWGEKVFMDRDNKDHLLLTDPSGNIASYWISSDSIYKWTRNVIYSHTINSVERVAGHLIAVAGGAVYDLVDTSGIQEMLYFDNSGKELLAIIPSDTTGSLIQVVDIYGNFYEMPIVPNISIREDLPLQHSFARVYPNPSSGVLTVQPNIRVFLEIYSVSGHTIEKGRWLDQREILDVSKYPTGMYILRLSSGENAQLVKFLKL